MVIELAPCSRLLAEATGNQLDEFAMNSAVDTSELLGGFEQVLLTLIHSLSTLYWIGPLFAWECLNLHLGV